MGIAVAGATDAARGASDIVLQQEGLSTIVKAIYGSRAIFKRIETYLTYRMCSSFVFGFVFLLVFCVSDYNFPTWTLILISILNDFAVSSSSKDNVVIQRKPSQLNILKLGTVAMSMALVSSLQVWGFMHSIVVYDGTDEHFWGIKPVDSTKFTGCEAAAFNFLVLIITLQLDLIAARSPKPFWYRVSSKKDDAGRFIGNPPPSIYVMGALAFSLTIATFIAVFWEDTIVLGSGYGLSGMGFRNAGFVWAWALMWFFITDLFKSGVIIFFDKIEKSSVKGNAWLIFFQNALTQEWDQDKADEKKKTTIQSLRDKIVSYDASMRSSDDLSVAISSSLQIGLPFHYTQDGTGTDEDGAAEWAPLTLQDELFSAQTLQDDDKLLKIISEMAHTIHSLQKQVQELSSGK